MTDEKNTPAAPEPRDDPTAGPDRSRFEELVDGMASATPVQDGTQPASGGLADEFSGRTETSAPAEDRFEPVEEASRARTSEPAPPAKTARTRTLWGDAWYRLRRNRLAFIAFVWIVIITVAAVTAPLWVPPLFGDPTTIDTVRASTQRLLGPSLQHPMGTDDLGRDIFGRIVYGARVSLLVGFVSVIISVVVGLLFGAFSGFYGSWIDAVIMRFTDIFLAFPYILFAILVLAVLPPEYRGVAAVTLVIGLLGWPTFARVFRSSVFTVKNNDYVQAARALGASDGRIMFRHIMPNAVAPIVVYATMSIGGAILTEAALSFLGLGILPPQISWGRMIEDGRGFLVTAPGLIFWPGLAILTTVLAFTLLGDGARDALDVKMKD
jgi:ABC-type dipeptide/oligopeptide/nickel transport system permease subunit